MQKSEFTPTLSEEREGERVPESTVAEGLHLPDENGGLPGPKLRTVPLRVQLPQIEQSC